MYAGVDGVTAYNILSMFGVEICAQTRGQGIQQGNGLKTSSCRGLIWVGNSLGPKEGWMLHLNLFHDNASDYNMMEQPIVQETTKQWR
jgi:hypothetical protein